MFKKIKRNLNQNQLSWIFSKFFYKYHIGIYTSILKMCVNILRNFFFLIENFNLFFF